MALGAWIKMIVPGAATTLVPQVCPDVMRPCSGQHLIHIGNKALAAAPLAPFGVFELGKAHLAYGQ